MAYFWVSGKFSYKAMAYFWVSGKFSYKPSMSMQWLTSG
jgi:hypothetical protein